MSYIRESDIPEGMVGNVPWGTPLNRWTDAMLDRALESGSVDDSPALAAAIRAERKTR